MKFEAFESKLHELAAACAPMANRRGRKLQILKTIVKILPIWMRIEAFESELHDRAAACGGRKLQMLQSMIKNQPMWKKIEAFPWLTIVVLIYCG